MTDSALKHHVVFLATSTDEKIRDLNIVAQYKQMPVHFFNLRDLVAELQNEVLHNTVEDGGSAEENAVKKLHGIKGKISKCRNDIKGVQEFCKKRGIEDFSAERIWFGTEDSGVTFPPEIWNNIPEALLENVLSKDVRERLQKQQQGPGVETAPFLSAMLGARNIQTLIEGGLESYVKEAMQGENPDNDDYKKAVREYLIDTLRFKEQSVICLERMALDHEKPVSINAEGIIGNKYFSSTLEGKASNGERFSNFDYLRVPRKHDNDTRSLAEMGTSYIGKYSARAAAFDKMVKEINCCTEDVYNGKGERLEAATPGQKYDLEIGIAARPDNFNIGIMNLPKKRASDRSHNLAVGRIRQGVFDRFVSESHAVGKHLVTRLEPEDNEPKGFSHLSPVEQATYYLSYPERTIANSDGLILLPDSVFAKKANLKKTSLKGGLGFTAKENSATSGASLDEKLYLLNSIVVAKQLVPRDIHKPVIIINTDHSWDKAINIHNALANMQMTKDHAIRLSPRLDGVTVDSNAYFDVINGDNYDAAVKAAMERMKDKSLTYHRVTPKPCETGKMGSDPIDRRDMTAIFCSASSENEPLNQLVRDLSYALAKEKQPITCGGGDRYTMGAILEGVLKLRDELMAALTHTAQQARDETLIAGISTKPIAAAESMEGEISEHYTYRELTENIYERMAKMLVPSKKVIVAPGGAGTIQEWMGFNLLKQKMPELFLDKSLVIFDPEMIEQKAENSRIQNRVFDDVLETYFGNKYRGFNREGQLTPIPGVRIATTVEGVMNTKLDDKSMRNLGDLNLFRVNIGGASSGSSLKR